MTFLYRALSTRAEGTAEFRDVPKNAYYADAVAWAAANGITTGIGGGLFGPDNDCTRAQIVTFLFRTYNKYSSRYNTDVGRRYYSAAPYSGFGSMNERYSYL